MAVLEAAVKSCGPVFHTEVGKFKFLNEMIKLVSPKYLVSTYVTVSMSFSNLNLQYFGSVDVAQFHDFLDEPIDDS